MVAISHADIVKAPKALLHDHLDGGHALLRRPVFWQRLVSDFVASTLGTHAY